MNPDRLVVSSLKRSALEDALIGRERERERERDKCLDIVGGL